jgi:endonuclease YncB( thermonuclease family)
MGTNPEALHSRNLILMAVQIRRMRRRRIQMKKLLLTGIATLFLAIPANAKPIDPADIWVLDGDTVRIHNKYPNVRLVGFNAPEIHNASCPAESELGAQATRRLRELVRAGGLDFTFVRCSCPETTQGTFACNYGRTCGTLKSNGRDVGTILIAEGLAVSFVCGPTHCPATPRPWCHQ